MRRNVIYSRELEKLANEFLEESIQSYPRKILTRRQGEMGTLCQTGGLVGLPKRVNMTLLVLVIAWVAFLRV
ncbi:putative 1-deoxy-D-xylulose-5-phosphate synthase, 1-deoxy-D-xylulose-5-phosphate reductoisomerase [Helianthus anomalus]